MILNFPLCNQQKRLRYIITIDSEETPTDVSKEIMPGIITVLISARTPEEGELLRKESVAMLNKKSTIQALCL